MQSLIQHKNSVLLLLTSEGSNTVTPAPTQIIMPYLKFKLYFETKEKYLIHSNKIKNSKYKNVI